jgi:hypothetical protein
LLSERSVSDFIKLNALPGLGLVAYTAYYGFTNATPPWYGALAVYVVLLGAQYAYRRQRIKQSLVDTLERNMKSFETVGDTFRSLCHRFENNPLDWFQKYVDDSHDLIVGGWLDLLKRAVRSRKDEAEEYQIRSWTNEFLRIVRHYRTTVIQAFIDRANAAKLVNKGTKNDFSDFKMQYNSLVDEINQLVKDINSRLAREKPLQASDRISVELEIQEIQ